MKKRYLALIMAGVMTFGTGYTAFAEEQTEISTEAGAEAAANELNWEDVAEAVEEAGWEGDFVSFDEIAVKMYVPDALQMTELTDEDRESGYIAYFMTEDESAAASVMYVDADGMELEEYRTYLEGEADVDEVEAGILNGVPVLTYTMPENDTACVSLATEAGYILEFAFSPISDEGFESVAQIMMASIQPDEQAEAETENGN